MLAVGVDGIPRGWIAIALRDGAFAGCEVVPTLEHVLEAFSGAAAFGVDIPIGLPDRYPRVADLLAKKFIGPLRAAVFMTPPRAVLEAGSFVEANALMREMAGCGLSQQSYALRRKILEAEGLAPRDERVVEVHPEVSFAELAQGSLSDSKHSWSGFHARVALLRSAGIALPLDLPRAPIADVLDAAVAAWSAGRYARRVARPLPEPAPGRIGAIWR